MIALESQNLYSSPLGSFALEDCKVSCDFGSVTVMIGPNGSGKTTLLRLFAGLIKPEKGQIRLYEKENMADLSPADRSRKLAWIPADTQVPFGFSVREVLELGLFPFQMASRAEIERRVYETLKYFELEEFSERLVPTLSTGERQQVMCARGFVADVPIVILDEPFANLDIANCFRLLSILRSYAHKKNYAIIASVHDLVLAHKLADAVVILDEGRCVASGSFKGALTPKIAAEVFGIKVNFVSGADGGECLVSSPMGPVPPMPPMPTPPK